MNIYTEVTPNPASLKFVVADKVLLQSGVADFPNPEAVGDRSPMADKLFKYSFVKGVMISQNFVTITKAEDAKWQDVIPVMKQEIEQSIRKGEVLSGDEAPEALTHAEDTELDKQIRQLIDEQVRPAVAMDGGDIVYEGFYDGVVKLQLRGSCSGCPSSIVTLKAGIQSLLQRMVPEVKSVEAV